MTGKAFQMDAAREKGKTLSKLPTNCPLRQCLIATIRACAGVGRIEGSGSRIQFKCGRQNGRLITADTVQTPCPVKEKVDLTPKDIG